MEETENRACPLFEDLSAWHDQEYQGPALNGHIENCELCQKTIAALVQIDQAVVTVPELSRQRVAFMVSRCSDRLSRRPFAFLTMPILLRIAAVLVLAGFVLHTRSQSRSAAVETVAAPIPAQPETTTRPGDPLPVTVVEGISAPRVKTNELPPGFATSEPGILNIDDLRPVAGGSDGGMVLSTSPDADVIRTFSGEISDNVRHLWLVEDPAVPLRALKALLPKNTEVLDQLVTEQRDRYLLRLTLTDEKLQGLVNQLYGLNCKLVSPDSPQPTSIRNTSFTGKPVRYDLDLIRR